MAVEGVVVRHIERESIGWSIGLSVVLIVLGLLALLAPLFAGVAVEAVLAWLVILAGVFHLWLAWHVRGAGSHTWEALIGLLYILVGGYLFLHPLVGLVGLTAFLGAYLLLKGLFELVAGFGIRRARGGGWMLLDAVISLVLAGIIWAHLFSSATWVIGTLIGFAILFSGISRLVFAMSARHHLVAAV